MGQDRLCPACKKTRLSRYNHDPLCTPCVRASQMAPPLPEPVTLAWLWDSLPMREALARVDLAAVVAVFRAAARLSQHELADILGWSQSSLSLIESGRRKTLYDIRELLRFTDAVDMPREALLPLVFGQALAALPGAWLAGVPLAGGDGLDETDVELDRRGFATMITGAAAGAMLPELAVPAKVTASHVRYLKTCVDNLSSRDQAVGGGALLKQAVRQWQRARRMLDESDYTEQVGQDLLSVTGNLAVTAGWLAFDSANISLAKHMYSESLLLAESANDPILKARVLGQSSMLSSYLAQQNSAAGLARHGLRLADRAASVAAHEPMPRLHALIALRRADAAALLGDEHTFKASIGSARDELGRGVSDDDPAWIQFVDEFEIDGMEAIGQLELGHYSEAVELDRMSLAGLGGAVRNRTCTHARLAATLALEGDTNSALDEARAVLAVLADGVKSPRTLNKLRPVRTIAQQVKDEDFCARFDAVFEALTA
jgi:transcriptional regulator with XRE-family HTH domain